MRLIAYTRVSKVAGRTGDSFQSPGEQRSAIEHIVALTPDARVVDWIEELDESGGSMDRPGVKRAIQAVDSGQADGIVTAYLDRWARTPEALEKIEAWAKSGRSFISAHERFDTSSSQGMFALGMMLLVAKYQRDRHVETWAASARNAIERGVTVVVPYGYRRADGKGSPLVLDGERANIVRTMFDARLRGESVSSIAHALNARAVPAPRGGHWTRQTVRALLRSPTYTGQARYGEHVQPDAHPFIVSVDEWERAQPARGEWRSGGKSMLGGMVRCAGCGYLMGAGSSGSSIGRRYNCNRHHATGQCPSPTTASAERLEQFVTLAFLERYADEGAQGAPSATVEAPAQRVEALRSEYVTWRDDVTMRVALGDADYRSGLIARKEALDIAAAEYEDAVRDARAATLTVDRAVWSSSTLAERRELLHAGIEAVVMRRAASTRTPLSERVEIRWAGDTAP